MYWREKPVRDRIPVRAPGVQVRHSNPTLDFLQHITFARQNSMYCNPLKCEFLRK
jgi:hypothetical protein